MPTERFDKLPELKKNRISDAISEAFMHRGTGDIHITQIARSARVSRGSLFSQQRRYAVFFAVPDAAVYLGK